MPSCSTPMRTSRAISSSVSTSTFGQPVQALGRHAVGAPQVAAVGQRDPQIGGHAAVTVDQPTGAGDRVGTAQHRVGQRARRGHPPNVVRGTAESDRAAGPSLLGSRCHPRDRRRTTRTRLWPESARDPVSPRTVFTPYVRLFTVPGSARFSFAGWVARLPIPMLGLGAVLLVEGETGSYALAGAVSGTLALSFSVVSPQWARAMDRRGQGVDPALGHGRRTCSSGIAFVSRRRRRRAPVELVRAGRADRRERPQHRLPGPRPLGRSARGPGRDGRPRSPWRPSSTRWSSSSGRRWSRCWPR